MNNQAQILAAMIVEELDVEVIEPLPAPTEANA